MKRHVDPRRFAPGEESMSDPPSVPYDLTDAEREHVRAALLALYARAKTWEEVAVATGYPVLYVLSFGDEKAAIKPRGQRHFAAKVAEALGVDIDDMLAGKAP